MRFVELRSDTKTLPTAEMYRAIAESELGDETDREDPTVNRLEELAAEKLGKEAALFVASGSMGNLVGVMSHCSRGEEVILGECCHIALWEQGSISVVAGLPMRQIENDRFGCLPLEKVRASFRPLDDVHEPLTGLICIENTHNRRGGTVLPLEYLSGLRKLADERSLPIHMDGARIFNAAVALGVDAREIAQYADSVQICLSKGLGAPFGSLVVGSAEYIGRARRARKLLGGSMRQAGIVAAPGIVALNSMVDRLAEDHANARRLAEGIAEIPGLTVDLETVQTNIVVVGLTTEKYNADSFVAALQSEGVLIYSMPGNAVRFVTHYMVNADDIDYAIHQTKKVMAA